MGLFATPMSWANVGRYYRYTPLTVLDLKKLKNMLTMIGAGTTSTIAIKQSCSGYRSVCLRWISVWFTPLLIRWGSKTSGLSSTLNYAWLFEVAHFFRRVEVAAKRPWNSLDIFGQVVLPPEIQAWPFWKGTHLPQRDPL